MVPLRMEILLSPPISSINEIIPVDQPEARLPYDSLLYQADKNHREFCSVDLEEGNE